MVVAYAGNVDGKNRGGRAGVGRARVAWIQRVEKHGKGVGAVGMGGRGADDGVVWFRSPGPTPESIGGRSSLLTAISRWAGVGVSVYRWGF